MGKIHFWPSFLPMTDEQAISNMQSGEDDQAFTHLVRRWREPILRLCSRMMGDEQRGEDLTQETFARVFARRMDFRPEAKFSTWLWRIALNLCYDEIRKRRRRGELASFESPAEEPEEDGERASEEKSPDLMAAAHEENNLAKEALLQLAEEHRSVLVLRYCEGLKLREVADILEIPQTTVSSRIAVALEQITRILEPQFDLPGKAAQRSPNQLKSMQNL